MEVLGDRLWKDENITAPASLETGFLNPESDIRNIICYPSLKERGDRDLLEVQGRYYAQGRNCYLWCSVVIIYPESIITVNFIIFLIATISLPPQELNFLMYKKYSLS